MQICLALVGSSFLCIYPLAVAHTWYWGSGYYIRGGPVCHEDHPEQRAAHSWTLSSMYIITHTLCGCGQMLAIREDARLFSVITGKRMVSFFVFSPSERTNPLTNLFRTRRLVHTFTINLFQLLDSSPHKQRSYFLSVSFSWKPNTQHQNKRIVKPVILHTHLAMWLQIFIFQLNQISKI